MTIDTSTQVPGFDWKVLLFSFQGRIRRQHFWIGWLILLGAGVVAKYIPILGPLILLALIWPHLAIAVKRLHDIGQSGWLVAIPWVVTIVALVVGFGTVGISAIANSAALENEDPAAIFALIAPAMGMFAVICLVNLGFMLWIGLTPGTNGDNRYGSDPKAAG
ncbi:DUF805 domain-containing protein [uncultured Brevundimonas sp.]|uniref:DUF805 domain-containing protein n=1 Tax=uncultured Brevundimonas sp. TaxID=213418 RepID=UPI0030ED4417